MNLKSKEAEPMQTHTIGNTTYNLDALKGKSDAEIKKAHEHIEDYDHAALMTALKGKEKPAEVK